LAIGVNVQRVEMPAEAIRDVQGEGVIAAGEDPEQLAFDLNAYLLLANAQYVALQGPDSHRAREAGDSHASRGGRRPTGQLDRLILGRWGTIPARRNLGG
jgi:hypothetical protein